jgi:hypothetical protein
LFLGHPNDKLTDLLHHTGTTDALPRIRPLRRDQPAVPCQNRIGSHDGGDRREGLPAKRLSFSRQPTALVVRETQASPAAPELVLQHTVLFDQIGDHCRLLATDPGGECCQEELQMDGLDHAASLSDAA